MKSKMFIFYVFVVFINSCRIYPGIIDEKITSCKIHKETENELIESCNSRYRRQELTIRNLEN
ncbi:hypothetical protein PT136_04315 (plasmid) [Borreliella garinii]|uniref:hypothetical protein n=1 Tax=Borreliella TaxID=64895 RepID=UPI001AED8C04|nr:hypothetical protein [Borreliella garinii]WNZ72061.1 hypothetical protein PT136_04315 [Borreliella garinii]